jgi:hypothetical protein
MVEACGNLAAHAENALIRKFAGKDLAVSEGVRRKLDCLRAELAGPNPPPLERLLVERVVTCWLHLHHLEAIYAGKESMSLDLGTYYQRCLSAAQNRYLAAIRTLARSCCACWSGRASATPHATGRPPLPGNALQSLTCSGSLD